MPVKLRYFLSGECSSFSPALTAIADLYEWSIALPYPRVRLLAYYLVMPAKYQAQEPRLELPAA